ncbi:hypothetical protein BKA64DRAFT_460460 [Cadophora sp. MPI-SDFR-AT-0126]|nr:hypothetical protein BKA64DRAFT_460460 [Leotiomycetes sp. MPI-SDFR-AT-0126]
MPEAFTGLAIHSNCVKVSCNCCERPIFAKHLHRMERNNFDVCMECYGKGFKGGNDAHEWTKMGIEDGERFDIEYISSRKKRKMQHDRATLTYPELFVPPEAHSTPKDLFENEHRFIRKTNRREILIFTDGACIGNGGNNPKAG